MNCNKVNVLVIVNPFPPLGRVGASVRTVKFLEYINSNKVNFFVITQNPDSPVYPTGIASQSILKNIPANVNIHRIKSFLRLPRILLPRNKVSSYKAEMKKIKAKSIKAVVRSFLRILRNFILIPDEDILWGLSIIKRSVKLVKQHNIDFIYASGPPFSSIVAGYLIAKLTNKKFIVDMKDDWIEVSNRLGKSRSLLELEKKIESIVLNYSSIVLVPTQYGISKIKDRHQSLKLENLEYLPNGCDLSEFRVLIKSPDYVHKTHAIFTIVCGSGGLSKDYRDIQTFLEAVAEAKSSNEEFNLRSKVVFLGSDVETNYKDVINENALKEILDFQSPLTREEYVGFLKKADMLLLVQINDAPSSISGTLYEYWSIEGIPIMLIGGNGATKDFLIQHSLGEAFDFSEVKRMSDYMLMVFDHWQNQNPIRTQPSDSIDKFDRRVLAQKFENIIISKMSL